MTDLAARLAGGFVLGAVVGSFATNLGVRAARGEQAIWGSSCCDACRAPIGLAHSAPVVSFFLLRGRCRACARRIDAVHPIGELAGGLLGAFALSASTWSEAGLRAALGFALLVTSVIDQKTQRLPDPITLLIGLAALGLAILRGAVMEGVIAALVVGAGLAVLRHTTGGARGPGLGLGDVKLAAALSLWLGLASSWMLVAATFIGLCLVAATRPADRRIAFGPWIACGAIVVGAAREWSGWTNLI